MRALQPPTRETLHHARPVLTECAPAHVPCRRWRAFQPTAPRQWQSTQWPCSWRSTGACDKCKGVGDSSSSSCRRVAVTPPWQELTLSLRRVHRQPHPCRPCVLQAPDTGPLTRPGWKLLPVSHQCALAVVGASFERPHTCSRQLARIPSADARAILPHSAPTPAFGAPGRRWLALR